MTRLHVPTLIMFACALLLMACAAGVFLAWVLCSVLMIIEPSPPGGWLYVCPVLAVLFAALGVFMEVRDRRRARARSRS